VALFTAGALVFAACGGDDDDTASTDTEAAATETTAAEEEPAAETTVAGGDEETTTSAADEEPAADVAMTLTVDINPDAVWEDGSPITWEDIECSWQAQLNTPGSIETSGYDAITGVAAGESDQQVVISFSRVYAPYKGLFDAIIKKAAVADCNDISTDFATELPISAQPYMLNSFGENELELVPNPNWWGEPAKAERVLVVGFADQETELAAINSGEVDFIYPQYFQGITDAVTDPNVVPSISFGGDYENLYFQMGEDESYRGPLADDDFRAALVKSIDREALF